MKKIILVLAILIALGAVAAMAFLNPAVREIRKEKTVEPDSRKKEQAPKSLREGMEEEIEATSTSELEKEEKNINRLTGAVKERSLSEREGVFSDD